MSTNKKHHSPFTARFWIWSGVGWVRLALRDGQSLAWSTGGPTDEGWTRTDERFTRVGDMIESEWCIDGRDCDGRLTQCGESFCHVLDLCADEPYTDEGLPVVDRVPRWERGRRGQRDEYAEAAGY